ncbi:MAG: glycosyltransferase family 2 protein [Deltaproteobacteria bacterium]|nr:glycosyltransferase family 2 protein [Deltaproteobacteria bacterium]MDQ3299919.1 glycosyltransferase family 2 protein [Myxococcota bacterium]
MAVVPVIDVVVPARDHATSLAPLLRELPHRLIRSVVVVDRASNDRTAEIARDGGALVLREPSGGYGAACLRAQAHFSSLPRVPDILLFIPGDRPSAASSLAALVEPLQERSVELVLGIEPGRRRVGEKLVTGLIDTVYGHRWSGLGPVRAMRFPALIALGMSDRGHGWDVEMLVRAVKLGLSCDEVVLPGDAHRLDRSLGPALLHILRHATMR